MGKHKSVNTLFPFYLIKCNALPCFVEISFLYCTIEPKRPLQVIIKIFKSMCKQFYIYRWVDRFLWTISPRWCNPPSSQCFGVYHIYLYLNIQFLSNVIIKITKVNISHTYVTLTDFSYPVDAHWFQRYTIVSFLDCTRTSIQSGGVKVILCVR